MVINLFLLVLPLPVISSLHAEIRKRLALTLSYTWILVRFPDARLKLFKKKN